MYAYNAKSSKQMAFFKKKKKENKNWEW